MEKPFISEGNIIGGNYRIGKRLGEGGFGQVYYATKINTNEEYAIKISKNKDKSLDKEKKLLIRIKEEQIPCPNITRIIDENFSNEDSKQDYIVTELCNGGNLARYMDMMEKKKRKIGIREIQYIMQEMMNGIAYLHDRGILHRDLKPSNILINYNNDKAKENFDILSSRIKICDFGLGKKVNKGEQTYSVLGTAKYMKHQIVIETLEKNRRVNGKGTYGYSTELDIWEAGLICYELVTGHYFISADTKEGIAEELERGEYKIKNGDDISLELIDFIDHMIQDSPLDQYSAKQLCYHDFLVKDISSFTPFPDKREFIELNHSKGIKDFNKLEKFGKKLNNFFLELNEGLLFFDQAVFPTAADEDEKGKDKEN